MHARVQKRALPRSRLYQQIQQVSSLRLFPEAAHARHGLWLLRLDSHAVTANGVMSSGISSSGITTGRNTGMTIKATPDMSNPMAVSIDPEGPRH